jgi:hypothetical protein
MIHSELSTLIGTRQVADSKVNEWLGRNVRCPSLIPGTLYIMKEWSVKHHANYDNPFQVVEFVGSGREDTGERVLFAENPAIKEMKDGDYFYFKAIDNNGQPFIFGAYMHENCVCVTSSAVRVTCYAVVGHESEGLPQGITRAPRVQTAAKLTRAKVASIDEDSIVDNCEEEDDGLGCKDAWLCHPISCRPLRLLRS